MPVSLQTSARPDVGAKSHGIICSTKVVGRLSKVKDPRVTYRFTTLDFPSSDSSSPSNFNKAVSIWKTQLSMHSETSCCRPTIQYDANNQHTINLKNQAKNRIAPNIITDSDVFLGGNGGGFVPDEAGAGSGSSIISFNSVSEEPGAPTPDGPASGFFEIIT